MTAAVPPRPAYPPPRPRGRRVRGARSTALVAGGALTVVLVPVTAERAVPGVAPIEPGRPVAVGDFDIRPAAGWRQDRSRSVAPELTLVRDGVRITFAPQNGTRTVRSLYDHAARRLRADTGRHAGADPAPFTTDTGLPGLAAPATDGPAGGVLAVVHDPGDRTGVIASVALPRDVSSAAVAAADAHRMILGARARR